MGTDPPIHYPPEEQSQSEENTCYVVKTLFAFHVFIAVIDTPKLSQFYNDLVTSHASSLR